VGAELGKQLEKASVWEAQMFGFIFDEITAKSGNSW